MKRSELEWHTQLGERADKYEEFSEYDYQKYIRHFIKETGIDTDDIVLELGCGTGAFTSRLSKMGYNVAGLDISHTMLLNARRDSNGNYVQGDIESLPCQDSTFDIVFASASLHHLPDLYLAASESYRVLKKGGRFFSLDPNRMNPIGWAEMNIPPIRKIVRENCMGRSPLTPTERYFTAREIMKVFGDAGFEQIKTYTINLIPFKQNTVLKNFEEMLEKMPVFNQFGGTIVHTSVKM